MHEAAEERARAEAAAAERDRLLGEVHDGLTQRLVSIRVHLDAAERDLAAGDGTGEAAAQLRQASTAARDALAETRLTLLGLASSPLQGQTLDEALRSEAAWAQSIGGLEVRYVCAGTPVAMEESLSLGVFRVAREALTNIVRHARGPVRPAGADVRAGGRDPPGPGRRAGLRSEVGMAGRPLRAARRQRARARARRLGRRRFAGRLGHQDPGPLPLPAR